MIREHIVLPIKVDATSNGEFLPTPPSPMLSQAKRLAASKITEHAKRTGMSRRNFLTI